MLDHAPQVLIGDVDPTSAIRGPFATVYRSRLGGATVAAKIYRPGIAHAWSERAMRERDALARISHPGVARLVDAGMLADGSPFLLSAWVDGESLEAALACRVPAAAALAVISALADALSAVHAVGVVHRDIKPSNIMIPRAGTPAAILVDFGHCLLAGDDRVTESGVALGSPAYTAPEQAAGDTVDARADLYALGVVLYRALTGELPFASASTAELLRLHQIEPVVPPRRRAPDRDIPAAVEDLCLWLLAKEPRARTPSARVLSITIRALGGL